jgi:acylphosphatase
VSRIRRRVIVHGKVHGVFFRDTTRKRARWILVSGWVRNRPDGTVEAVFEGRPSAVRRMIEFVHEGPPDAVVDRVEVFEERPAGERGFRVTG